MTTYFFSSNSVGATPRATLADSDRLIVLSGVTIATIDVFASTINVAGSSTQITIEGGVYNGQSSAISGTGGSTTISVGAQGWIESDQAAVLLIGAKVDNAGRIHSSAGAGIFLGGGNNSVTNTGEITSGASYAVSFEGNTGTVNTFVNAGTVTGVRAFVGGNSNDIVTNTGLLAGTGSGTIDLGAGDDMLDSRDGRVIGRVFGGSGDDTLLLGIGDDLLEGGPGGDMLDGGAGFDTATYSSATAAVHVSLSDPISNSGDAAGDTYVSIEGLLGSSFADQLIGDGNANRLNGGGNADVMQGLGGNDTYWVDTPADVVIEAAGGGTDRVVTSVSYTLTAGQEIEQFATTNASATAPITLIGNAFNNTLQGNAGDNLLDGGAGNDVLYGLAGDDTYAVDSASDRAVETAGKGNDGVFASVSFTLEAASEIERLITNNAAATTAINLTGNEFGNTLQGNAGSNILNGGGGNDTMSGFGGNDQYYVDSASDRAIEAVGDGIDRVLASVSFTLEAGSEIEVLTTTNAASPIPINLTGNEFANSVQGNAGANTINGGAGKDALTGFGGQDNFLFNTALNAGTNFDTIGDFVIADDTIQLDDAIFTGLATGALSAAAFRAGTAAADADDRIIYNSGNGFMSFDADGNGAGAAIAFARVTAGLALTAADFFVV